MSDEWYQPVPTVPPPAGPPPGWGGGGAGSDVPAPAQDERRRIRIELLVMTVAAAVPGIVIGLRGFTDPETVSTDIGVLELIAGLIASLGPSAIAVYLLWRDGRLGAAGFGRRSAGFVLGWGLLGVVMCFVVLFVVGLLALIVTGELDDVAEQRIEEQEEAEDDDGIAFTVPSMLVAAAFALSAGVGEEVLYRAYAITRLEELGLRRAALVAPAAVFTLGHLYQGPLALVAIGALAALFTWLYRWKRSVWPVMVAHAGYDMAIFAIIAASGSA